MSTMKLNVPVSKGVVVPLSPTDGEVKRSRSVNALHDSMFGRLTEAPGRLTPTGQGRIKAPPVCSAPSLKRVASTIDDFTGEGVCFSPEEAAARASKSVCMGGKGDDAPFNIETCQASFQWGNGASDDALKSTDDYPESKFFMSSSSTVVTNTSVSTCGRGGAGCERLVKKDPPMEVVRTDDNGVNSEDEHLGGLVHQDIARASSKPSRSKSLPLSNSFNDNLVKGKQSRQGRTLQRWLVHSETEELVRQVAGCIPITRDGRVILVSASRKSEWILPKGGWDADESKEECAARETFEEAGVLGSLGACLDPIDYETRKAKKRRASGDSVKGKDAVSPLPKRVKTGGGFVSPTEGTLATACASDEGAEDKQLSPDPENYKFVRLFLFPLFVTDVKSEWPEGGRLRKLVDIDEAIAIMDQEDRPYFRAGLLQVKARGLNTRDGSSVGCSGN